MPTGGEILEAMDRQLGALRRDAETLDEQFRRERDELAAARQEQISVFAKLARLRIQEIASGELLQCLDDTDRQVTELLQVRKAAEQSLGADLASAAAALAAVETARARERPIVAAAAQAAEAAVAQAKAALEANGNYSSMLARAAAARETAERAEAKSAAAEEDRLVKAKPYDADPVFTYLWRKGFGTSAYRSTGLVRTLDSAVARASGYERLRRDYWLLQEIPRRLAEHAQRMRSQASESLAVARALEEQAAHAAGVPPKQRALAEAERRLAEIDKEIAQHEAAVDAAVERRSAFAAGEDEHSTRCSELLTQALERADMQELRKKAARTATEEDDRLIADLERLERQRASRQQELIRLRRLHQTYRERTLGLEEIRRRFKQSRFDDARSVFAGGPFTGDLLDKFAAGSIDVDKLWQGIARQQSGRP